MKNEVLAGTKYHQHRTGGSCDLDTFSLCLCFFCSPASASIASIITQYIQPPMSPPGEGFGGFQAQQPASAEIDASTPFVAAGDGDLELLQSSMKQLGLPPNAADSNGFTFLHAACGYCRVEVIQWLLGLNREGNNIIDVNARDGDHDTPLHHCDDAISARMLIEGGADHQLRNDEGKTALEVKEEELHEEDDEDDDSDDEDREKLKELVAYLKGLSPSG